MNPCDRKWEGVAVLCVYTAHPLSLTADPGWDNAASQICLVQGAMWPGDRMVAQMRRKEWQGTLIAGDIMEGVSDEKDRMMDTDDE